MDYIRVAVMGKINNTLHLFMVGIMASVDGISVM